MLAREWRHVVLRSVSASTSSVLPTLPSTTAALRFSPLNLARFIGDFRNTARKPSSSCARRSRASVRASFPAMNSRGANGESSANACENFTFHGHTSWEMCRYNRVMVELETVRRTLSVPRGEGPSARRIRGSPLLITLTVGHRPRYKQSLRRGSVPALRVESLASIKGADQGVRVLGLQHQGVSIKGSESLTHFEVEDSDPLIGPLDRDSHAPWCSAR